MSAGLDQINVPPPGLSLGADIYRAYRLGDSTREEYLIANACMVADHSHEEKPRIYVPIPGPAEHYAQSRIAGGRDYDKTASKALGMWRFDTFQAMDHNLYIEEHFRWALEKCRHVRLDTQCERLGGAIRRFEILRFPHEAYGLACTVLKMDSDVKQRGAA